MFVGLYRFICDIVLALLWLVAVVLGLLFVVLMFICAIIAGVVGVLIFGVMCVRNYPTRPSGSGLLLKL